MYKVFFNNKVVLLTENYDLGRIRTGELFLTYNDFEELGFVVNLLEESALLNRVVIESDDLEVLWSDFRALFKEIDAAGGVVINDNHELLLIYRNGIWDLPKGKYEAGETMEECALREVEEECGIHDLILKSKLDVSYHSYHLKGFRILKCTHWYVMKSGQTQFTPQLEEGITDVKWVPLADLNPKDYPTYKSIEEVVNTFTSTIDQL